MRNPFHDLTRALSRLGDRRHARAALDAALAHPHMARDLGLPQRPETGRRPLP